MVRHDVFPMDSSSMRVILLDLKKEQKQNHYNSDGKTKRTVQFYSPLNQHSLAFRFLKKTCSWLAARTCAAHVWRHWWARWWHFQVQTETCYLLRHLSWTLRILRSSRDRSNAAEIGLRGLRGSKQRIHPLTDLIRFYIALRPYRPRDDSLRSGFLHVHMYA